MRSKLQEWICIQLQSAIDVKLLPQSKLYCSTLLQTSSKHWFLSTQEWYYHNHLMIALPCRCGLALFYLPASSTLLSSNQNSTRATLPSINYIKTTNRDQRAALPTASITLTGVVNGWPKNSRHRAYLSESLVRITGVTCHSVASVWLQEWFDQWSAMPRGF